MDNMNRRVPFLSLHYQITSGNFIPAILKEAGTEYYLH